MSNSEPDFDRLDPRLFRAFVSAAKTLNFTEAARLAAMTQSGVSQHIARLEQQLGVPLFQRVRKAVHLTGEGRRLLDYIAAYEDTLEAFLDSVQERQRTLDGVVSYAMPPSCQLSPHLPMLLKERRKHPGLTLRVEIGSNDDVYRLVSDGRVDFGFVTRRQDDPTLEYTHFCDEEVVLVGRLPDLPQGLSETLTEQDLPKLPFVAFPGGSQYLDDWLDHHFPKLPRRIRNDMRVTATIGSIEGAIVMLREGAGCVAIPHHCVEELLRKKVVSTFRTSAVRAPMLNRIDIVRLQGTRQPRCVRQVIEWFMAMK